MHELLSNWVERHQHPFNWAIHLVGIPLGNLAPLALAGAGHWWWAAAAFAAGYVLQFLGHAVEGNDPGEIILVKKLLGRPYVTAVSRRNSALTTPTPRQRQQPTLSVVRDP